MMKENKQVEYPAENQPHCEPTNLTKKETKLTT